MENIVKSTHHKKSNKKIEDESNVTSSSVVMADAHTAGNPVNDTPTDETVKKILLNLGDLAYMAPGYYPHRDNPAVIIPNFSQYNLRKFLIHACGLHTERIENISNEELIPFIVASVIQNDQATLDMLENIKQLLNFSQIATHNIATITSSLTAVNERIDLVLEKKNSDLVEFIKVLEENKTPTTSIINEDMLLAPIRKEINFIRNDYGATMELQSQKIVSGEARITALERTVGELGVSLEKLSLTVKDVVGSLAAMRSDIKQIEKTNEANYQALQSILASRASRSGEEGNLAARVAVLEREGRIKLPALGSSLTSSYLSLSNS